MPNTTTAQIAAGANFYDRRLLQRAKPYLIHTMFGQVKDIPANAGESTKFRRYGVLAAALTALTEGVTPPGSQLAVSDITVTPAQYGDYIVLTDRLLFTTLDPVLTETAEILGDQAGLTLDVITRDILAAGTTVYYGGDATSRVTVDATDLISSGNAIARALKGLKNQKARPITQMVQAGTGVGTVPIQSAFVAFNHVNTTQDLETISGFVRIEQYPQGRSLLSESEVGYFKRTRFIETTEGKVFTGAGALGIDVYATIIVAQNAYGITRIGGQALRNIVKGLGTAGTADPLDQRATSGWKATFAAVRLNDAWMARIEHSVSA